jgi:hypothetical protein
LDDAAMTNTADHSDTSVSAPSTSAAPEWFGSTARATAFFPAMMSVYLLIYASSWPAAWGVAGTIACAAVAVYAIVFIVRGIRQIRHARRYPAVKTPEGARIDRAMGLLNAVTHPVWMAGAVVLILNGQERWVLPLMVFVIGAHFLPMGSILSRKIDYLLGPVAMLFAVFAGILAANSDVPTAEVWAVAGIGGALSTGSYAAYMARNYAQLAKTAGVEFP